MSSRFERLDSEPLYDGGFISLQRMRFRHEDGEIVERDIVVHTGAVGVVTLDEQDQLWFVRQPREAVGVPDLLEIPAGKLDMEGESPLEGAQRELREEAGVEAATWREIGRAHISNSITDEAATLYLATGLRPVPQALESSEADLTVDWVAFDEVMAMVLDGRVTDAMSIIALQRVALERTGAGG